MSLTNAVPIKVELTGEKARYSGAITITLKTTSMVISLESMKEKASKEPVSNSEIVKLIKENSLDNLNYALFSVERPYAKSEPHADYFLFIGEFPKSQNTAFDIRSYTTQKEAEKLFDALDMKYLHN